VIGGERREARGARRAAEDVGATSPVPSLSADDDDDDDDDDIVGAVYVNAPLSSSI
jgi:hypothetical protein